jgi:hypothetical protein
MIPQRPKVTLMKDILRMVSLLLLAALFGAFSCGKNPMKQARLSPQSAKIVQQLAEKEMEARSCLAGSQKLTPAEHAQLIQEKAVPLFKECAETVGNMDRSRMKKKEREYFDLLYEYYLLQMKIAQTRIAVLLYRRESDILEHRNLNAQEINLMKQLNGSMVQE